MLTRALPRSRSRRALQLLGAWGVGLATLACAVSAPARTIESHGPAETASPMNAPASGSVAPPPMSLVIRQGDRLAEGAVVQEVGIPVTDGAGGVGFTGLLEDGADGEGFVWRNGSILWRHSQSQSPVLRFISPLMGLGSSAQFVFQTTLDGLDGLWSHHGELLRKDQPAPGFPAGTTILVSRRTMMTPNGTAYWVSEFRDGPGNKGRGRVLYKSADAQPANTSVVLRSDDLVEGLPLSRPWGLDFHFQISPNGAHHIQVANVDSGSADDDDILIVDGAIALREGQPADPAAGDHWKRFGRVAINDQGDYLVAVETDAQNARDTVIAYNGTVVLREGGVAGETPVLPQASVLALAIDARGRAAHLWSVQGFGKEYLFFACDAARLDRSTLLVESKKPLDFGDPEVRIAVDAFNSVGHGSALWLDSSDFLHVEVDLHDRAQHPSQELEEAILRVPLPSCPNGGEAPTSR